MNDECDLLLCVNAGLDAFGLNMKNAIFTELGADAEMSPTELLSDPEAFENALKKVFGEGYVLAERSIIREMKKKFDLSAPGSSYSIGDAFVVVRRKLRSQSSFKRTSSR